MKRPRLCIAGTHSGAGKTTVTLGILGALVERGLVVQAFKVGPDYIDPTYHTAITGRPSRNLDAWMLNRDGIPSLFSHASSDASISIIEGVMGLFDGKDPLSNEGSTADVCDILQVPVILVVDVSGTARSAAAMVLGYQAFCPSVHVAGVIVNRVGSEGHYKLVQQAIESACRVPVLGYVLQNRAIEVPERHLGLVPAIERGEMGPLMRAMREAIRETVDVERLVQIANHAAPLRVHVQPLFPGPRRSPMTKIAVAKDVAFSFYYPENLELLEHFGASLIYYSPVAGERVPDEADGLYLGGGFPEVYAAQLAQHEAPMTDLKQRIQAGLPVLAECGGYMVVTNEIVDLDGQAHPMLGSIPASVQMTNRLAGFGYREVQGTGENWLLAPGERIRGHAFHYSTISFVDGKTAPGYASTLTNPGRDGVMTEGYATPNLIAGYTHLYFPSNPNVARAFVERCVEYGQRRR